MCLHTVREELSLLYFAPDNPLSVDIVATNRGCVGNFSKMREEISLLSPWCIRGREWPFADDDCVAASD